MVSGAAFTLMEGYLSDLFGISAPFLLAGLMGVAALLFYTIKRPRILL
jgi:fucose permease